MALTDTAVKNAKPFEKPRKLFDERGLFLLVNSKGKKWWRFKYRFQGKEKLLSLGVYPDVSLKEARNRRDEMRRQIANGIDPSEQRKAIKAAQSNRDGNSFEVVAREWFAKNELVWSASHSSKIIRRLERDIFPWLGGRPIAEITPPELLKIIQKIEDRGTIETAHRAMQNCGQVFRFAVASGRAERDPTNDLRGALSPVKQGHFAAVTEPKEVGPLLHTLDGYQGTPTVCAALKFAPLVFVRPGELRQALWADINFDEAEWRYFVKKTESNHIVPLARQAIKILKELHPITQHSKYVFPAATSPRRPMSDNAILAALRRMEIPKDQMRSGSGNLYNGYKWISGLQIGMMPTTGDPI